MDVVMDRVKSLSYYGLYLIGQEYLVRCNRAFTKGYDNETAKYLRDCLARSYFS
jgi:hypothetical protein